MRPIFLVIVFIILSPGSPCAQDLQPTDKKALMTVKTVNMDNKKPRPDQKVTFTAKGSGEKYTKMTAEDGTFQILLPKGETYNVAYQTLSEETEYQELDIPDKPGQMSFTFTIEYQLPSKITLRDVHFNTGKATLREDSYPALNELVKALKRKPDLKVEIAGHTDDQGDARSNMELSRQRAQAVVDHLTEKGIGTSRLKAKGYGETQPIASNGTAEGRQKNRRTEVRILEK